MGRTFSPTNVITVYLLLLPLYFQPVLSGNEDTQEESVVADRQIGGQFLQSPFTLNTMLSGRITTSVDCDSGTNRSCDVCM